MYKSLAFVCFCSLITFVDLYANLNDSGVSSSQPIVDVGSPPIADDGSPPIADDGSPPIVDDGSPPIVDDGSPPIVYDGSPSVVGDVEMELVVPELLPLSGDEGQAPPSSSDDASNSDDPEETTDETTEGTTALSSNDSALFVVVARFPRCSVVPNTSRAATFLDLASGVTDLDSIFQDAEEGDAMYRSGVTKVTCVPQNVSDLDGPPSVRIVNSSELLQQLGSRNATSGRCTIVLFYAPWCVFSAQVAPHYNALARAFPTLDVVAIDAFHFSNLNSRFGTIAVPNVMVFHSAKAIARFNGTERTLEYLASFVANVTGVQANASVGVTEDDRIGPLPSEPTLETDYLLVISWLFVVLCCVMGAVRSSAGVRVWNTLVAMGHHEQRHHQHID